MRGQSYKQESMAQSDQPQLPRFDTLNTDTISMAIMDDNENSEIDEDLFSSTKLPSAAIGQYSKSVLVNTQSVSHSYIYDPDMPIFDLDHSANVTGLLGKTAVLNCRVRNIGNKTVRLFLIYAIANEPYPH